MPASIRVVVQPAEDPQTVRLLLAFAAPEHGERLAPAHAGIDFGDGQAADLGLIVPPTAATWLTQRTLHLAEHTYRGLSPYTDCAQANMYALTAAPGRPGGSPITLQAPDHGSADWSMPRAASIR